MIYMSAVLAAMSEAQRQGYYQACAKVALAHYALGPITVHFVQHNAGIVYRLEDGDGNACYLLKIHESAGDGLMDTPAQLTAQMLWLQALSADGRVMVQAPIANRAGDFVTEVQLLGLDRLSAVCVQRWITAQHVAQWEEEHAYAVGGLLAMCDLVRQVAVSIAERYDFTYPHGDDQRVSAHLRHVRALPKTATTMY